MKSIGADAVIPFTLGALHPSGVKNYEQALKEVFARGVTWSSIIYGAIAREVSSSRLQSRLKTLLPSALSTWVEQAARGDRAPGAALRSSAIQLMGSSAKSVPLPKLLDGIRHVFEAAAPAKLQIATQTMRLDQIEEAWKAPLKPRVVVTVGSAW